MTECDGNSLPVRLHVARDSDHPVRSRAARGVALVGRDSDGERRGIGPESGLLIGIYLCAICKSYDRPSRKEINRSSAISGLASFAALLRFLARSPLAFRQYIFACFACSLVMPYCSYFVSLTLTAYPPRAFFASSPARRSTILITIMILLSSALPFSLPPRPGGPHQCCACSYRALSPI